MRLNNEPSSAAGDAHGSTSGDFEGKVIECLGFGIFAMRNFRLACSKRTKVVSTIEMGDLLVLGSDITELNISLSWPVGHIGQAWFVFLVWCVLHKRSESLGGSK